MSAYYNENDPYAAQWLRNLIARNLIAPGDVDERSILDVKPNDLAGYDQCHFFAGLGGWSYSLRLAGWPDDRPVWTGSCPCQPFSAAGKRKGEADERHLWPEFRRLIAECRPPVLFGEQVAAGLGRQWLAGVRTDLEALGYAVGAADLCAAGLGAPHIRQRLWWVADAQCGAAKRRGHDLAVASGSAENETPQRERVRNDSRPNSATDGPGDADDTRLEGRCVPRRERARERTPWPAGGDALWLPCSDGKARRIEPGLEPLAHGVQSCLVRCGDIEAAAIQEVLGAALDPDPREALRILWQAIRTTLHQRPVVGPRSIRSAEVLFSFLLGLRAACNATAYGRYGPETSKAVHWRALRFLRMVRKLDRSPRRRRPNEQQAAELADPLRVLSFNLACHAETYWQAAEDAYAATNRLRRLRAYGNAIVPQVAVEFIKAYADDPTQCAR